LIRFRLAYLRNNQAEMDQIAAESRGRAGAEDTITFNQGLVSASHGQLNMATQQFQRAADLARGAGQQERAAVFTAAIAMINALYQRQTEAKQAVEAAQRLASGGRDIQFAVAFPLSLSAEAARAKAIADDLDKRFPEDTSVRASYLPALRGAVALSGGDAQGALTILQPTLATELYLPGLGFNSFYGKMLPTYLRGQAYLVLGRGAEAAAEFQKIVDHRGFINTDPIGTLARFQLARALAQAGDKVRAKAAYEEVLDRWKNADAGLKVVEQAREEAKRI
jgi:tetratricopeptide (TPR) repeat protein